MIERKWENYVVDTEFHIIPRCSGICKCLLMRSWFSSSPVGFPSRSSLGFTSLTGDALDVPSALVWQICLHTCCYNRVVQLEGIFKDYLIQLKGYFGADQKSQHINEGIAQVPFEHRQAWGINHFSRKPVTVSDPPHGKERLVRTSFGTSYCCSHIWSSVCPLGY